LPVAASVEPVPVGLAAAGWDRAAAGEGGEGPLADEAVGVVAGGDQRRGGVGADAVQRDEFGCGCGRDPPQAGVDLLEPLVQRLDALRQVA
jgi:hypothetical protein